jgi:secreted PhoX family phosphatase
MLSIIRQSRSFGPQPAADDLQYTPDAATPWHVNRQTYSGEEQITVFKLTRRTFLRHTVITAGAAALQGLVARRALAENPYARLQALPGEGGYGPLYPTPSRNTNETFLELPKGFSYTVLGKTGALMTDGNPTPRAHDGMAAFAGDGVLRLVRNHEINNGKGSPGAAIGGAAPAYDYSAGGGTTTLVIDPATREIIRDFVSLNGSLHNCAGGPTPWGSWITCEETTLGTDIIRDEERNREWGGFDKNHGYCFEVPAALDKPAAPVPLKGMGRFIHEAIAVDPATGIVYETEDRNPAGFYRFIPDRPGDLAAGGRLQMLAIRDRPQHDTRTGQRMGAVLPVTWVDIDDPDPANASTEPLAVHYQGYQRGGAVFSRLEGCWYGNGSIFFTATSGGDETLGQVWAYHPAADGSGTLKLLFESPNEDLLKGPDNVTVSPAGGLVLCEDGGGVQLVRGLTPDGRIFDLARDIVGIEHRGEFAGAAFSPDGQTLFLNMQRPGVTYAIWGPWREGAL